MNRYGTPASWLAVVVFGVFVNTFFIWVAWQVVIG